jgi:glutamate N-acetyltransferase/amino-acid N-acetyltransferase
VVAVTGGSASAAAVFTDNLVQAAPVRLSRDHLAATGSGDGSGLASGVIVTSGCANAATGAAGDSDQLAVAQRLADRLGRPAEEMLVASTGLIGTRLPVAAVGGAVATLVPDGLAATDEAFAAVATAIMTTDSRSKIASLDVTLDGADGSRPGVRIAGLGKGVGMIHPRMATLIGIVLTDARVAPAALGSMLRDAVADTYNQISVDGDTSTNDTVFLLASGAADAPEIVPGTPAADTFQAGLAAVCRSLARQHAADGEGASTLITCRVTGAADRVDARAVARAVVSSSLFKAAVHGRDPNWGRIVMAAGNGRRPDGTQVRLEVDRLSVRVAGTEVFHGEPVPFDAAPVARAMDAAEVVIELDLGVGDGVGEAWGCDLTEAYVIENSAYST